MHLRDLLKHPDTYLWFDLDDTIWDMSGNSRQVLAALFATDPAIAASFASTGPDDWTDTYHRVNAALWRDYAEGVISQTYLRSERFAAPLRISGLDKDAADAQARRLDRLYLDWLGSCTATVDGAPALVRDLHDAGRHMGIISNGFHPVQEHKLASAGLAGIFTPIILSEDAGANKPAAVFFDHALAAAGTTAGASIAIGDNPKTDIAGALEAGWAGAVWLNPRRLPLPQDLLHHSPKIIQIQSLAQLRPLLFGARQRP